MEAQIYRGQIYYASIPDLGGCVQRGTRPVVIVSNNIGNQHSQIVTVVPITSKSKKEFPTNFDVLLPGVHGTVLCNHIYTLPKETLGDFIGCLSSFYLKELKRCLVVALDLEGQYSGNAPHIEETIVNDQIERCKLAEENFKKQIEILHHMMGNETQKKETKREYIKRTPKEISEFITLWEDESQNKDVLIERFKFTSKAAAVVFYNRHKGDKK